MLKAEQASDMLRAMLKSILKTYIVIDALDEFGDRSNLVKWLKDFCTFFPNHVQVILTNRRENDLQSIIRTFIGEEGIFCLQQHLLKSDILYYIRTRIMLPEGGFQRWHSHPNVLQEITDRLAQRADGMYAFPNSKE